MEIKNIRPTYPSDGEEQAQMEEVYRRCLAALADLRSQEGEREE